MIHISPPDRFCPQWCVYVENRAGAVTAEAYFDTRHEAEDHAKTWHEKMKRTGHVIGASHHEP
ncbi:MAG: hypothetical protein M9924_21165 [Rhizobiaceae bacterium]|nr:hypothetical protein [Rhizobiaceae bacterium]